MSTQKLNQCREKLRLTGSWVLQTLARLIEGAIALTGGACTNEDAPNLPTRQEGQEHLNCDLLNTWHVDNTRHSFMRAPGSIGINSQLPRRRSGLPCTGGQCKDRCSLPTSPAPAMCLRMPCTRAPAASPQPLAKLLALALSLDAT